MKQPGLQVQDAGVIQEMTGLREGVRAMRVPRGLLFHDPIRWRLFSAPAGLAPEKLRAFLRQNGLDDAAPEPARKPRLRQLFWVPMDQVPERGLRTRPGARFACVCCGKSCRTLQLGPVLPADVERLLELDWSGSGRDTGTFFVDEHDQPIDPRETTLPIFLRRTSTGCQFLQDDNLCNVHARFGMAAKPLMCRMFPHTFRATPTAVSVGMRLGECASAPATSLGLPVIEQHPELEQMLAEHDAIGLVPPSIWATPDRLISWEEYEAIETALFARSGDFVTAVFHAFNPGAQPGTGLERILERATLAGRQAQTLEPAALELEDRFCRGVVFGKDLFLHQDLAQAAALLVIKRELGRIEAADGTPAALNAVWKKAAERSLRAMCHDVDVRAVAAAIVAS